MKIVLLKCRALSAFVILSLLAAPQIASAIELKAAVQKTLEHSPELLLYPYHVRALDGQALQAGLKPNPRLNAELENVFGTGDNRFLSNSEITLSLSQLIELGQQPERRVAVVDRKAAAIEQDYQIKRLDVVAAMLRDYFNSLRLQQLIEWNQQRIKAEQAAVAVIHRRARAGVVGKADVMRMQLRLAKSEARQTDLEAQHTQSLRVLAAHWTAEPEFSRVEGALGHLPVLPDRAMLAAALQNTPDFLLAQSEVRVNEARLELAQAEGKADVTVGAGIRRQEGTNDNALLFSFSMPLQWHNSNQGNIASAQAQYQEKLANQDLLRTRLEVALSRIHSALQNNLARLQQLDDQLLPAAKELLSEVKRGYQLGQYGVLQWVDAQQELFSVEQQVIEVQLAVQLQFLELERLSGASLTTTADKE